MAPQRGASPTWIGARPTAGATALLVVEVAVFLVFMFLDAPGWIARHLALVPRRAIGPEPWQLVTTGLFHLRGMALVSSAIGIWIFGTAVEQMAGRGRMFLHFVAGQLVGAVGIGLLGRLVAPDRTFDGCEPGVLALVAAFGVYYGRVPLRFFGIVEMRGRTMALIVIGLTFLVGLLNRELVVLAGGAAAIAVSWAIASGHGRRLLAAWDRLRLWRLRRRYKIIPGGRDSKRWLN